MNQTLQAIFGEAIRTHRKERKISQERLALDCDLQRSFISRIERGISQPTLVTIFEIAKALGTEPALLIAEVQKKWQRKA